MSLNSRPWKDKERDFNNWLYNFSCSPKIHTVAGDTEDVPQGPSGWMCQNRMAYTESDVRMVKMSKDDFKTQPGEITAARKSASKTICIEKGAAASRKL